MSTMIRITILNNDNEEILLDYFSKENITHIATQLPSTVLLEEVEGRVGDNVCVGDETGLHILEPEDLEKK